MKKNFLLHYSLRLCEKILLPYHCVMCLGASDQRRDLCRQCQIELPVPPHTCFQCGIAFPYAQHVNRCGQCIAHPPYFDDTIVGFNYQTPIDVWLRQFKFHKKGLYARILTEIYAEKLSSILEHQPENTPSILIPMPLNWRRIAQRGFNQAYIITLQLSKKLHLPILKHRCVSRIKYTQAQSRLSQRARRQNMQGAFSIQNLPEIEHVAIIDDVFTTGNTVNELAKQLKLHGVKRVSVWALARAN